MDRAATPNLSITIARASQAIACLAACGCADECTGPRHAQGQPPILLHKLPTDPLALVTLQIDAGNTKAAMLMVKLGWPLTVKGATGVPPPSTSPSSATTPSLAAALAWTLDISVFTSGSLHAKVAQASRNTRGCCGVARAKPFRPSTTD